jgi:hypothetical protein
MMEGNFGSRAMWSERRVWLLADRVMRQQRTVGGFAAFAATDVVQRSSRHSSNTNARSTRHRTGSMVWPAPRRPRSERGDAVKANLYREKFGQLATAHSDRPELLASKRPLTENWGLPANRGDYAVQSFHQFKWARRPTMVRVIAVETLCYMLDGLGSRTVSPRALCCRSAAGN